MRLGQQQKNQSSAISDQLAAPIAALQQRELENGGNTISWPSHVPSCGAWDKPQASR